MPSGIMRELGQSAKEAVQTASKLIGATGRGLCLRRGAIGAKALQVITLFASIISLSFLPLSSSSMAATDSWPDCGFVCQAGDVSVIDLWVGDASGNRLISCDSGTTVAAYIWAKIQNGASSKRKAIVLLADVYVNNDLIYTTYPQGICVLNSISGKSTVSVPICSFSFNCDDDVKLSRFILSWETAGSITCSNANRKCSNRNTKCYGGSLTELYVATPLKCIIDGPNALCNNNNAIYNAIINENLPYTYTYTWSIDGTAQGNEKSFSLIGSSLLPGSHNIKLGIKAWQGGHTVYTRDCSMNLVVVPLPKIDITVS
jgi:hypothetical protein